MQLCAALCFVCQSAASAVNKPFAQYLFNDRSSIICPMKLVACDDAVFFKYIWLVGSNHLALFKMLVLDFVGSRHLARIEKA